MKEEQLCELCIAAQSRENIGNEIFNKNPGQMIKKRSLVVKQGCDMKGIVIVQKKS